MDVFMACLGRKQRHNPILIKKDAYIGVNALQPARIELIIGKNTVIGAYMLVNKSILDRFTIAGVLAKIIN